MHTQNVNVKTAAQESSRKMGEKPMRTTNIALTSNLPPLRGLDVRMAWGMAQVMRVIDREKADEEMKSAIDEAFICGHNDFSYGEDAVPPGMYSDAPPLIKAWHKGWRSASASEAMQICPGCHNERGEPCPWHD